MNCILNEGTAVEDYDINKPDIHEINYLLDDILKIVEKKYFHNFE